MSPLNKALATLVTAGVLAAACFAFQNGEPAASPTESAPAEPPVPAAERVYPANVTHHDFADDLDVLYLHHFEGMMNGGPMATWPLFREVRRFFIDLTDDDILARHVSGMFPTEGEPKFAELNQQVKECAEVLGVETPPRVFVHQNSDLNAYVTGIEAPHVLVVTSGLLDAYADRPDELRFIIGHEMGHIRCRHVHAHMIAGFLVQSLVGKNETRLKRFVITPGLIWKLLEWRRASEYSADRAGLICVGHIPADPHFAERTAEQSLLRLLHGTRHTVDADHYLDNVIKLEKGERFVSVLRKFRELGHGHPFISNRLIALRAWEGGGEYEMLLERGNRRGEVRPLTVTEIHISGLPDTDVAFSRNKRRSDPIISAVCCDRELRARHLKNNSSPQLSRLSWKFDWVENSRLLIDVRDYDAVSGADRIGSVVFRPAGKSGWLEGSLISEPGINASRAKVRVRVIVGEGSL